MRSTLKLPPLSCTAKNPSFGHKSKNIRIVQSSSFHRLKKKNNLCLLLVKPAHLWNENLWCMTTDVKSQCNERCNLHTSHLKKKSFTEGFKDENGFENGEESDVS